MIDLMDNLVARWERFAGKPYAKPTNKPSGLVIRNTVSQAQDTLYRLKLGRVRQCWLDVVERLNPVQPAGPPQTLGELCLEVSRPVVDKVYQEDGLTIEFVDMYPKVVYDALRRVLYHKHKYPKEERLYRLIDAVRNA